MQIHAHREEGGGDEMSERFAEWSTPQNQFSIRSYIDLPHDFEFDTTLYYVESIGSGTMVPSYVRVDSRLGWQINENLELSVVAQNLFDNRHYEFFEDSFGSYGTEVQRSYYAQMTLRF